MSHIIQIGNSHGVRIPKNLIEKAGLLNAELTLKVVPEGLLISPHSRPRNGWAEAFKAVAVEKSDQELQHIKNKFDEEDWEW